VAGIFLSYRREDASGWAGRLFASLRAQLPDTTVFMDVDNIPPGVKFAEYIAQSVAGCDVLLALVGPRWSSEENLRRLGELNEKGEPKDFVRLEIVAALQRNVRVVPTRVGDATLPARSALPEDMRELLERNDYVISDRSWDDDCRRLVAALRPLLGEGGSPIDRRKLAMAAGSVAALAGAGVLGYRAWNPPRISGSKPPTAPLTSGTSTTAVADTPAPAPHQDPQPAPPPHPMPAALLKLPVAGTWRMTRDGGNGEGPSFIIERSGDGFEISVQSRSESTPKMIGSLRASGRDAIFESPQPKTPRVTASEGTAPGLWNIEYAFYDRPAGQPEKLMFSARGEAKVDRALRHMSAFLEDNSRKDSPRKIRFQMTLSPDARQLDATVTGPEAGATPERAVFVRQ